MSPRQALTSALHLFVVFFAFAAALFFVCLPYLPELQVRVSDLILYRAEACTGIGLGLFVLTFLLSLGFYALNGGTFLRINMGRHLVEIDSKVIRSTIEDCLKKQCSEKIVLQDLEIIWDRSIEISARIDSMKPEEKKQALARMEAELSALLRKRFGYKRPFILNLAQDPK